MKPAARKKNRLTLGEAIDAFIKKFNLQEGIHEVKVQNNWELWMGKTIAKYTRELRLKNKILFVKVDSAPLRQELLYMKDSIVRRVNEECKEEVICEVIIQ